MLNCRRRKLAQFIPWGVVFIFLLLFSLNFTSTIVNLSILNHKFLIVVSPKRLFFHTRQHSNYNLILTMDIFNSIDLVIMLGFSTNSRLSWGTQCTSRFCFKEPVIVIPFIVAKQHYGVTQADIKGGRRIHLWMSGHTKKKRNLNLGLAEICKPIWRNTSEWWLWRYQ